MAFVLVVTCVRMVIPIAGVTAGRIPISDTPVMARLTSVASVMIVVVGFVFHGVTSF